MIGNVVSAEAASSFSEVNLNTSVMILVHYNIDSILSNAVLQLSI